MVILYLHSRETLLGLDHYKKKTIIQGLRKWKKLIFFITKKIVKYIYAKFSLCVCVCVCV